MSLRITPEQLGLLLSRDVRVGKISKPKPALEVRTHIALADLLRVNARPSFWWSHIPAGEKRSKATGGLLKRMGLRRGLPDFLFIGPDGQHYWMELKRGTAPLNDAQLEFEMMAGERHVPHAVARSYNEAEAQLKQWGVLD